MLCDDVKRVVYFFLDGSMGQSRQQDFQSHLDGCPDCAARTNVHRRIRDFVRKKLTVDAAPIRLKNRLTRSIRAFRTEWSQ